MYCYCEASSMWNKLYTVMSYLILCFYPFFILAPLSSTHPHLSLPFWLLNSLLKRYSSTSQIFFFCFRYLSLPKSVSLNFHLIGLHRFHTAIGLSSYVILGCQGGKVVDSSLKYFFWIRVSFLKLHFMIFNTP